MEYWIGLKKKRPIIPCETGSMVTTARILGPGFIRRDAIRRAVLKALRSQDLASGVHSFVGAVVPVHNYLVVPVLQLPVKLLERVPSLRVPVSDDGTDSCSPSLLHATITEVLKASRSALLEPSPGILQPTARWPSPEETVNRAAGTFMYTLQVVAQGHMLWISDLFKECNRIASWRVRRENRKRYLSPVRSYWRCYQHDSYILTACALPRTALVP